MFCFITEHCGWRLSSRRLLTSWFKSGSARPITSSTQQTLTSKSSTQTSFASRPWRSAIRTTSGQLSHDSWLYKLNPILAIVVRSDINNVVYDISFDKGIGVGSSESILVILMKSRLTIVTWTYMYLSNGRTEGKAVRRSELPLRIATPCYVHTCTIQIYYNWL